jgi:RNA polymerase sigma-70 factor (ECF subfamily)
VPPLPEHEAAAEEARLLARIGTGDREALRELYARYKAPLFSLAVRLLGNAGESEELLQDTFVKVWQHAASYDARKSRPFTWAVTILRRGGIDALRRRGRRVATQPLDLGTEPAAAGETARGAAEAHEDAERLRGALASLPPDPRRALELALFSALTQSEIAQRLRQPVGTVKSWIRRGLLDLRATLASPAL